MTKSTIIIDSLFIWGLVGSAAVIARGPAAPARHGLCLGLGERAAACCLVGRSALALASACLGLAIQMVLIGPLP